MTFWHGYRPCFDFLTAITQNPYLTLPRDHVLVCGMLGSVLLFLVGSKTRSETCLMPNSLYLFLGLQKRVQEKNIFVFGLLFFLIDLTERPLSGLFVVWVCLGGLLTSKSMSARLKV